MTLESALPLAQKYLEQIRPFCKRAEIAGSIRRLKPEVKDIEIVAIRNVRKIVELKNWLDKFYRIKGNIMGKYTQRKLPEGINLDLFFADEYNWGCIFLIRTGPWEFSKRMMGTVTREKGFVQNDGYLWKNGEIIPVQEENNWFELMGLTWISPENRS